MPKPQRGHQSGTNMCNVPSTCYLGQAWEEHPLPNPHGFKLDQSHRAQIADPCADLYDSTDIFVMQKNYPCPRQLLFPSLIPFKIYKPRWTFSLQNSVLSIKCMQPFNLPFLFYTPSPQLPTQLPTPNSFIVILGNICNKWCKRYAINEICLNTEKTNGTVLIERH